MWFLIASSSLCCDAGQGSQQAEETQGTAHTIKGTKALEHLRYLTSTALDCTAPLTH